jgi:hypothetical protein
MRRPLRRFRQRSGRVCSRPTSRRRRLLRRRQEKHDQPRRAARTGSSGTCSSSRPEPDNKNPASRRGQNPLIRRQAGGPALSCCLLGGSPMAAPFPPASSFPLRPASGPMRRISVRQCPGSRAAAPQLLGTRQPSCVPDWHDSNNFNQLRKRYLAVDPGTCPKRKISRHLVVTRVRHRPVPVPDRIAAT